MERSRNDIDQTRLVITTKRYKTMRDKDKDLIMKLLKAEIADAEYAVHHCKANGYDELSGQVERLREVNEAYYAMILSDNSEHRQP